MNWKYITALTLLAGFTACQDDLGNDGFTNSSDRLDLYAGSPEEFVKSRAVNDPAFPGGTLFHLYGTKVILDADNKPVGEEWDVNYLQSTPGGADIARGIGGTSTTDLDGMRNRQMTGVARKFHAKPLNFYALSVTHDDATEDDQSVYNLMCDNFLSTSRTTEGVPQYHVEHQGDPLPDILWSGSLKNLTPYHNSGKIVMPFRHTLSKLKFYAVCADEVTRSIAINSLKLGDYPDGILNLQDGLYTRVDANLARNAVIPVCDGKVISVGHDLPAVLQPFATAMVFPTTGAVYDEKYEKAVADDDAVSISLGISVDGVANATPLEAKLMLGNQNFAFRPGYEYDIVFTLTTQSVVVTIIPRYYEYVDNDHDLGLNEVGEPVDFGGMLWAAANLGASSSHPTANALEWEKARGFYYQFGRNIPFFVRGSVNEPYPYVKSYDDVTDETTNEARWYLHENVRTLYGGAASSTNVNIPFSVRARAALHYLHCARAYPYIPYLWEQEIEAAGGNVTRGYNRFLENYQAQCNWQRHHSDTDDGRGTYTLSFLSEDKTPLSDPNMAYYIGNKTSAGLTIEKYMFSYFAYGFQNQDSTVVHNYAWNETHAASDTNWDDPHNHPCPKGWRIPTEEEMLSVMPGGAKAGDLSFNNVGGAYGYNPNTDGKHEGRSYYEVIDSDYKGEKAVYVGIYQDGLGNNDLGVENHTTVKDVTEHKQGWGTVYAIKRQGTKNAYAVRWQVVVVDKNGKDSDGTTPVTQARFENDKPYVGRGVLVISKYNLGAEGATLNLYANRTQNATATGPTLEPEYDCLAYADTNGDNTKQSSEKIVELEWDNPSGQIEIPITGYIITAGMGNGLIYAGSEALYWTSTPYVNSNGRKFGVAARMKYAGDYPDRYLYLRREDYRSYGANIRCVRDTKADYK